MPAPNLETELSRQQMDALTDHANRDGYSVTDRDAWRVIVEAPSTDRPRLLDACETSTVTALGVLAATIPNKRHVIQRWMPEIDLLTRQITEARQGREAELAEKHRREQERLKQEREQQLAEQAARRRRDWEAEQRRPHATSTPPDAA